LYKLPWYSVPDLPFPPRARRRRRKTRQVSSSQNAIQLPIRDEQESPELDQPSELDGASLSLATGSPQSRASTLLGNATTESGSISEQLETGSTQPTTPSSVATVPKEITTPRQSVRPAVVPIVPVAPRSSPHQKVSAPTLPSASQEGPTPVDSLVGDGENSTSQGTAEQNPDSQPPLTVKAPPKSWADLVRTKPQRSSVAPSTVENQSPSASTLSISKATSLAEVIKAFKVEGDSRFSYLEPRGLVNTGNMCYMNSVSN
jgi:ubiquitin carboxyl-terminal hydrolase 10